MLRPRAAARLALLIVPSLASAQAPQPADVRASIPDVQAAWRAGREAPVARLLRDEAMRAALARFARSESFDPARLAEPLLHSSGCTDGDIEVLTSLASSLRAASFEVRGAGAQWTRLAELAALAAGATDAADAAQAIDPHFAVVLTLDFADPAAASATAGLAARLAGEGAAAKTDASRPGLALYAVGESAHASWWTWSQGTRMAIGLGAAPSVASLAEIAPLAAADVDRQLGAARGTVTGHVDARVGADGEATADAAAPAPARLVLRSEYTGGRAQLDASIPVGELDRILVDGPIDRDAAPHCPADAVIAVIAHVDGSALGRAVAAHWAKAEGVDPEALLDAPLADSGLRLGPDVFGKLSGDLVLYMRPLRAIGVPLVVASFELTDAATVSSFLDQAPKILSPGLVESARIRRSPYKQTPITTAALGRLTLAAAVVDGRLCVALSRSALIDLVKAGADGATERAVHPLFDEAAKFAPEASAVWRIDVVSLLDGAFGLASGFARMAGGGDELPVDLAALPRAELLGRYLEPSRGSLRRAGDRWSVHTESSIGPETPFVLAALGAWVASAIEARSSSEAEVDSQAPAVASPARSTSQALHDIETALAIYRLEHARYPAGLSELSKPTENFPAGPLGGQELPVDGWARAFHYELGSGGASYRLRSLGPDGIDQGGAGDDVVGERASGS